MTDHGNHLKISEPLSAFLDGEANPEETQALLEALQRDPRLRQTLDHHQRLRADLHGELHPRLGDAFVERVMAGIGTAIGDLAADKVVPLRPRRPHPLMRTVFGLATAASLAAVAVLSVQALLPSTDAAFPALTAAAPEAGAGIEVAAAGSRGEHWDELSPEAAAELHNYLLSHNSSAMDHGVSGTLGFMRVAADDGAHFGGSGR